jgi:predicted transcriptional regulator
MLELNYSICFHTKKIQRIKKLNKIKVVDKKTFRLWCNEMKINTKQASAILGISRPQVYKYINESSDHHISDTVKIICELLNTLSETELTHYITQKLIEKGCGDSWPSEKPVSQS